MHFPFLLLVLAVVLSACVQTTNETAKEKSAADIVDDRPAFEVVAKPAIQACISRAEGGNIEAAAIEAAGGIKSSIGTGFVLPYAGRYKSGFLTSPNRLALIFDHRSLVGVTLGCELNTLDIAGASKLPEMILLGLLEAGFLPERSKSKSLI